MMGNRLSIAGPQLGIAFLPILATAARFLIPIGVGVGAYALIAEEDETGEKKTFGIENWRVAYSSLAGGIGAAAFLGGPVLPEDLRPVSTIVGVLGSAVAVAILFWPSEKKGPPPPPLVRDGRVPPEQELPLVASAVVARSLRVRMPEAQETAGGRSRSSNVPQDYEFFATNLSKEPLSFFAGAKLTVPETVELRYRTPATDEPTYGRRPITVPPDGKPYRFTVKVPKLGLGWALYRDLDVGIEIFRTLGDRDPVIESNIIQIRYATFGWEI